MPDTVVIVGATGFVGRNLVRFLKGRAARVLPVSSAGATVEGIAGLTLADLETADLSPDTVLVHLAAIRYDPATFAAMQPAILAGNVELTNHLYRLCADKGIAEMRVASSSAVYPAGEMDFDDAQPLDLNRDPNAGELMYGWSKRIGEIYAHAFHRQKIVNTVSFRLSNPYGPHDTLDQDKAHVATAFVIRALSGAGPFEIRGNPAAIRDFVYVGDVCEVLTRSLAWRGRNEVYNLGSGYDTTIEQLARAVLALAAPGRPLDVIGDGGGIAVRRCLNGRLRTAFAIERFTPLHDGLAPTIDWYRDALARRA